MAAFIRTVSRIINESWQSHPVDAHIREMIARVDAAIAEGGPTLTQFRKVIRTIVEVNAKSPHEQRVLIHDLSFLGRPAREGLVRTE